MTTLKEIATGRSDLFRINLNDINITDGFNVREHTAEYEAHIDALAKSIAEVGVLEPLRGYLADDKFYLTNGHSRVAACRLANEAYGATIESVPILPEPKYSNEADRVLTLLTSNSGRPLSSLEVAAVYKRLVAYGWSEADIARKSGVSLAVVTQKLELAALPETVKELIRDDKVSATYALEVVKSGDVEKLTEAAEKTEGKVTKQKLEGVERAPRGSKTTVKAIMESAMATADDGEDETVRVTFTLEQYNQLLKLLNL